VQRLVNDFNGGDRDTSDTLVDWVAKVAYDVSDSVTLRLEGGRKTRSPSYIERFAWLPIEATAGLADGNNYVGRVGLDPEVAHEVGVGADWTTSSAYFRPRIFYRDVDDFITGTPFDDTPGTIDSDVERVSNANGDSTPLIYSNTGAEFYGFDVDFGYRFTESLRMDGQVSLTRAERTDIDDNVYRVPPAQGNLRFTYARSRWSAFVGTDLAADEDRISETNNDPSTEDPRTPGHAIVNLGGTWRVTQGANVQLAVNNLFDDSYEQQLGGFNRVANSDVGVGQRLPGTGRSIIMRVTAAF
jgi:iron complex outermembrane receptor protein